MPRGPKSAPLLFSALVAASALCATASASDAGCPEGMRFFGGGTFVLADGSARVTARPFCLDVIEVTAVAYGACVRAGRCAAAELACSRAATWGDPERATHPINCVSWLEADAFCRLARKRLPAEGEWEWAARGGARATPFPWGSAPPARRACWDGKGNTLGKGGRKETCPVGAHPDGDSPDGLSDLSGNVREWTSSSEGRFKVVRGGSWGDSLPDFLAVAFRGMNAPDERFELTGFRCAADPSPSAPSSAPPVLARAPRAAPPTPPPAAKVPVFQVDAIRIEVRGAR